MKQHYQSPTMSWAPIELTHCICESINLSPSRNLGDMHNISFDL